jgi:site-specific DNA-methyltransferase (adenine-specific)
MLMGRHPIGQEACFVITPASLGIDIGHAPWVSVGPTLLIQGDARALLKNMAGLADLVVTDPPYKLTSGGRSAVMGGKFSMTNYDNSGLLMDVVKWSEIATPIFAATRADADCYVMCNDKNMQACLNWFGDAGWKLHNILTWDKISPTRNRWYMKNLEFVCYFWKGKAKTINDPGSKQSFVLPRPKEAIHPTQKPVSMLQKWITNSSEPGELVLEPFSGSAATLVAAMRSGRRAVGIEFSPQHFERSVQRLRSEWSHIMRGSLQGDCHD